MTQKSKRVLIADDEALVVLGFKTVLKQLGYEIVGEACDGIMAVELAKETEPDLIIMDIKMPRLDGIQALEQINSGRKHILPCIFITAHSDEYLVSRAKEAGAFNYMIKPVQFNSLRVAIDVALARYEDYMKLVDERDNAKLMLENRKVIERAKGYLMDNFNMKENQAMEFMQKKSCDANKKMVDIAKGILSMAEMLS